MSLRKIKLRMPEQKQMLTASLISEWEEGGNKLGSWDMAIKGSGGSGHWPRDAEGTVGVSRRENVSPRGL